MWGLGGTKLLSKLHVRGECDIKGNFGEALHFRTRESSSESNQKGRGGTKGRLKGAPRNDVRT